ncbi:MAG: DUF255 domain-containing protein [Bacteroidota bacterium]|nr:DUF255 domain-containing protein [Bacteroidota bacterium]
MKHYAILFLMFLMTISFCQAQKIKVFNPAANAREDLLKAIELAKKTDRHVLVKIGYNQCPWCIKLYHFLNEDLEIDSLLKADYVIIKVNYSKENRNADVMESLGFPQRFGFPVLVILDEKGKRLNTQNTLYLEKDKSYDRKLIINFLKAWNRQAIDPGNY